jgi:hypothetical protein
VSPMIGASTARGRARTRSERERQPQVVDRWSAERHGATRWRARRAEGGRFERGGDGFVRSQRGGAAADPVPRARASALRASEDDFSRRSCASCSRLAPHASKMTPTRRK